MKFNTPKKAFNRIVRHLSIPREEGMAFLQAAEKGDLAAVKAFVEKYGKEGLEVRDRDWSPKNEALWKTDQETAIRIASWEKHKDIVEYLIKAGADVNAFDKRGYTALMVSHTPDMAALLLDAGAKIDHAQIDGSTVLSWPTTAEMIRFLCARGANLEARDKEGKTALMRVAEGHYARGDATLEGNLAALLECGADINARDARGRTAMMLAAARAAFEEESMASVKFLLKNNANLYLKDNDGKTAADHARAPLEPMEPGCMDIARLAMEKPDEAMKKRIAALVDRLAVKGREKIDRDCQQGMRKKVGVLKPLQLKR